MMNLAFSYLYQIGIQVTGKLACYLKLRSRVGCSTTQACNQRHGDKLQWKQHAWVGESIGRPKSNSSVEMVALKVQFLLTAVQWSLKEMLKVSSDGLKTCLHMKLHIDKYLVEGCWSYLDNVPGNGFCSSYSMWVLFPYTSLVSVPHIRYVTSFFRHHIALETAMPFTIIITLLFIFLTV